MSEIRIWVDDIKQGMQRLGNKFLGFISSVDLAYVHHTIVL